MNSNNLKQSSSNQSVTKACKVLNEYRNCNYSYGLTTPKGLLANCINDILPDVSNFLMWTPVFPQSKNQPYLPIEHMCLMVTVECKRKDTSIYKVVEDAYYGLVTTSDGQRGRIFYTMNDHGQPEIVKDPVIAWRYALKVVEPYVPN